MTREEFVAKAKELGYVLSFDSDGDLQNCMSTSESDFARVLVNYDIFKKRTTSFSVSVSGCKVETIDEVDAYMSDLENAKKFIGLAKVFLNKGDEI